MEKLGWNGHKKKRRIGNKEEIKQENYKEYENDDGVMAKKKKNLRIEKR